MSELKEHIFSDIDEVFPRGYCGPLPSQEVRPYYLKSEADKVIAELKEKLNNSRNARKYWRKEYLIEYKESIHHKYKRCLTMAMWCRTSARCDEGLGAFKYRDWYWKWFKRWLAIADKFKPNSTINRKEATNAL